MNVLKENLQNSVASSLSSFITFQLAYFDKYNLVLLKMKYQTSFSEILNVISQFQSTRTHITLFLTLVRFPALFQPHVGIIVFARNRATILDKIFVVYMSQ